MRAARCVAVGEAGELQHCGNVRLVLRAQITHVLVVLQVILAVGQLQTALQQVGVVVLVVVKARRHPQAEEIGGVEVGVVQRIDVGAQGFAQCPRQLLLVLDSSDGLQPSLQRLAAFGGNRLFVHVGVVEVGDLARVRSCRRIRLGDLLDERLGPLAGDVAEHGEDAYRSAVGRNLRPAEPGAVAVAVEVVARLGGAVHVADGDAMVGAFRRSRALGGEGSSQQAGQKQNGKQADKREQFGLNLHANVLLRMKRKPTAQSNEVSQPRRVPRRLQRGGLGSSLGRHPFLKEPGSGLERLLVPQSSE